MAVVRAHSAPPQSENINPESSTAVSSFGVEAEAPRDLTRSLETVNTGSGLVGPVPSPQTRLNDKKYRAGARHPPRMRATHGPYRFPHPSPQHMMLQNSPSNIPTHPGQMVTRGSRPQGSPREAAPAPAQYPIGEPPRTIAAQTRSILLAGMPQRRRSTQVPYVDRRIDRRSSTSDSSAARPRTGSRVVFENHQAYQAKVGPPANILVLATPLRHLGRFVTSDRSQRPGRRDQVTISVKVHPHAGEHEPFRLTRNFDLTQLRHALSTGSSPWSTGVGDVRQSQGSIVMPSPRRASMMSSRPVPPSPSYRRGTVLNPVGDGKGPAGTICAVPIHFDYARSYFPVVAALMLSGHIHEGDTIELPLPHPEAWQQNVSHVYSGCGQVTETMGQNTLYLAGSA